MRKAIAVLAVSLSFSFSSIARADVLPLDDCGINHKKEGEPCKDTAGKEGACGTITYTSSNHATNPPTQNTRSYLGCRTGEKPTAGSDKPGARKGCSASSRDAGEGMFVLAAVGWVLASRRRRRC